ncbi:phage integrase SAM-like domain-containing protein [Neolewinella agarilytica]|uniref:Site-specific recombinase XerD n=1 Tax=Neolewinella agarilytica TaxID=478744 RepID=A0A1H9D5P2_9BACT|nr:tyrosine-type recombinase/integrase [Neolewinella agarilytica]SEQ08128.1 Site-specific recombinase XerD [Neolewinella agarilytica]
MKKRNPGRRPPTPNFYITEGGIINVRFSYRGKRVSISLQMYIKPSEWDNRKQSPKRSLRGRNDVERIISSLQKWEDVVHQLFREVGETLTNEGFKQEVLYRVGAEDRPGEMPKDFHGYLSAFIALRKDTPGKTRTSWGKFEALQRHLKEFEKDTKQELDWSKFDYQFKDDFTAWMYAPPRNFANNNAAKLMAALRQVMRDAYRKKIHMNTIQEDREFIIRRQSTNCKVRLTVPELYAIEHLDLSDRPGMDKARDLMIFAAWTGLRISDWYGITRANFHEKDGQTTLQLVTSKTMTAVVIPVVPQVENIFEKYNYKLPRIAPAYFNRLIKEVCREAIPEATFTRVYSEGGNTVKETALKADYVSSHSGRKSFASNMYEATGVAYPIMQITGHKTESVFQKYIELKKAETVKTIHSPALNLANWQPA